MLSNQLRIIIIVSMLLALIYIISNIRRQKINFRYGIGWMLVAVLIMLLAIWPQILDLISYALGIAVPVNMLFFMGFILLPYFVSFLYPSLAISCFSYAHVQLIPLTFHLCFYVNWSF